MKVDGRPKFASHLQKCLSFAALKRWNDFTSIIGHGSNALLYMSQTQLSHKFMWSTSFDWFHLDHEAFFTTGQGGIMAEDRVWIKCWSSHELISKCLIMLMYKSALICFHDLVKFGLIQSSISNWWKWPSEKKLNNRY